MGDVHLRQTRERIWLLSPALATGVFFALRLALGSAEVSSVSSQLRGAGAETPVAMPTVVRVVSEIRRADAPRDRRAVPATEADLLRLLEQEGTVTFQASEVDVVATSAPEFAPTTLSVPKSED